MRLRSPSLSLSARAWFAVVMVLATVAMLAVSADRTVHARTEARVDVLALQSAGGNAYDLLEALVDQETGQRGFVITGDPGFLGPYADGRSRESRAESQLRAAFAGRPGLLSEIDAVTVAAQNWRAVAAEPEIAAARQGRFAEAVAKVRTGVGKAAFDQVRARLAVLKNDVDAAEADAVAVARLVRIRLDSILLAIGGIGVLMLIGSALFARRWVLTPLARISTAVREVSAGAINTTVPSTGPPELARLGADVEAMRQRVLREAAAAEAANVSLRRAETRLRLVLDNLGDFGVLGLDATGTITSWNTEAARRSERNAAHSAGLGLSVHDPGWVDAVGIPLHELAEAARSGQVETTHPRQDHPDGATHWYRTVITAIRDETGDLLGFADISQDLTAAKQAEEALRRAHAQLADQATLLTERADQLADALTFTAHCDVARIDVTLQAGRLVEDDPYDLALTTPERLEP